MGITTPLDAVVSMPLGTKEVLPIDMAGAVASIAADGMWHRPYYIDRVEGPDGQVIFEHEADPRRAATVQSARLACEVLEKNVAERHRHPGPHPRTSTPPARPARRRTPATAGSSGFTPYLATAVWIGSPTDNDAVEIRGTGHHRRLVPGGDLGPVHAGLARGPRGSRVRGAASRRTAARATCRWTEATTRGGGAAAVRPRRGRADPSTVPVHDPARIRRPPRPPAPRCPPSHDHHRRGRRRGRRMAPTTAPTADPVSAAPGEVRGWRAMTRWDDLLAVQEHDTTIDQLVHRRSHLPSQAELDGGDGRAGRAWRPAPPRSRTTRHGLGRDQQRLEDEITSLNERANHHDKTLYSGTIGNPRELQSLQDEIASLKRRISQLEDQELEVMEQIEPLDAQLATLRRVAGRARRAGRRPPRADRRGGGGDRRRARAGARRARRAGGARSIPSSSPSTTSCGSGPGASPSPASWAARAAAAT